MEQLGGRAIHPVNVRSGRLLRRSRRGGTEAPAEQLRRALDDALATVHWVAGFDFPDLESTTNSWR